MASAALEKDNNDDALNFIRLAAGFKHTLETTEIAFKRLRADGLAVLRNAVRSRSRRTHNESIKALEAFADVVSLLERWALSAKKMATEAAKSAVAHAAPTAMAPTIVTDTLDLKSGQPHQQPAATFAALNAQRQPAAILAAPSNAPRWEVPDEDNEQAHKEQFKVLKQAIEENKKELDRLKTDLPCKLKFSAVHVVVNDRIVPAVQFEIERLVYDPRTSEDAEANAAWERLVGSVVRRGLPSAFTDVVPADRIVVEVEQIIVPLGASAGKAAMLS